MCRKKALQLEHHSVVPAPFSTSLPLLISAGHIIATIFHGESANSGTRLRPVVIRARCRAARGEISPYLPAVSPRDLARAILRSDITAGTGILNLTPPVSPEMDGRGERGEFTSVGLARRYDHEGIVRSCKMAERRRGDVWEEGHKDADGDRRTKKGWRTAQWCHLSLGGASGEDCIRIRLQGYKQQWLTKSCYLLTKCIVVYPATITLKHLAGLESSGHVVVVTPPSTSAFIIINRPHK